MDTTSTTLATVLGTLAGGWAAGLGGALACEGRLLFGRPRVLRPAPAGPHERHLTLAVRVPVQPGCSLPGVLTRPWRDALGGLGSSARTVVLWFGGRNEDVRWTPALASWFGAEHAVAAFAYRGHGGAGGRPSERAVVADALALVRWLRDEDRFPTQHLVLAGRSIGSAVAVQVAAALPQPPAALILLSPMDGVQRLVRTMPGLAPAARWMRSPFDSLAAVPAIDCPVQVLLAEHDARVPHAASMRLVHALRARARPLPVQVQTVPGTTHRSLPRAAATLQAMAGFLDDVPATPSGRTLPAA